MNVFSKLALGTAMAVVIAGGAQAATLGLNTAAPAATGDGIVSVDFGTLDMFGDINGGTDAALNGLPVFFLYDGIGGDFELDIELASVVDIGFFDQTLEFLLSNTLSSFSDEVLLTITGSVFAGIDGSTDLDSFLSDTYPGGVFDADVTFALSAVTPVPLPASLASFALALGGLGVWSRRKAKIRP